MRCAGRKHRMNHDLDLRPRVCDISSFGAEARKDSHQSHIPRKLGPQQATVAHGDERRDTYGPTADAEIDWQNRGDDALQTMRGSERAHGSSCSTTRNRRVDVCKP